MTDGARKAAVLVALLGGNAVPLVGLVGRGWPPVTGMLSYLIDNVLMVLAIALAVRLFAPAAASADEGGRRRSELLKTFLLIAAPFSFGAAVLIAFFAVLRDTAFGPDFLIGIVTMAVFQVFSFAAVASSVRRGGLPAAEAIMERALGRVFLLAVAVYAGLGAAMFINEAFVVPFAVAKTLADLWRMPRQFRPAKQDSVAT